MPPDVRYLNKFTDLNCKTEEIDHNMLSISIYVVYLISVYVHKRLVFSIFLPVIVTFKIIHSFSQAIQRQFISTRVLLIFCIVHDRW